MSGNKEREKNLFDFVLNKEKSFFCGKI